MMVVTSYSQAEYKDPSVCVQSLGTYEYEASTFYTAYDNLKASEYSWTCQYVGDASVELWSHIRNHFVSTKSTYANYLARAIIGHGEVANGG